MARPLILFTDLDGALLDSGGSFAAAGEALRGLAQRRVPLIISSSQTRAEIEVVRRKLGNSDPFISENGGGIFVPHGYFAALPQGASSVGRYHCLSQGRPHAEVLRELREVCAETGAEIVGFSDMTAREIARNTGLSPAQAQRARAREFDEPFFFAGTKREAERRFAAAAAQRGLALARGDRFWHAFAGSDKGHALRELAELYRRGWRTRLRSAAVGSAENDGPMLAAADIAVLLPAADGQFSSAVTERLPRARRASAPGPAGWNDAVLEILRQNYG